MDQTAFVRVSELVRRRSGIVLNAEKSGAVARRLEPVARLFGYTQARHLFAELEHPHEELARAVVEALTTQDTSFFRDEAVFSHFERAILPALMAARAMKKRLRLWSAGCSTGQEVFSLAMLLDEQGLAQDGWHVDLFATDLSSESVARVKDGVYYRYEIERGLSPERIARHFTSDGNVWRIAERLRRSIVCRQFNLLDHFGWLGETDVVFCRNVLLYLAPEERPAVLEKLSDTLAADGYLVLGNAESIDSPCFKTVPDVRGVFVKK